jgi:hypothetical protein
LEQKGAHPSDEILVTLKNLCADGPPFALACGKVPVEISLWKSYTRQTAEMFFSSIRDNAGLLWRNQFVGDAAPAYLTRHQRADEIRQI